MGEYTLHNTNDAQMPSVSQTEAGTSNISNFNTNTIPEIAQVNITCPLIQRGAS